MLLFDLTLVITDLNDFTTSEACNSLLIKVSQTKYLKKQGNIHDLRNYSQESFI